jgi:TolA-binding protein
MTCPGELERSRALTVGADPEIAVHVAACATCRAAWDAEQAAIELARELPVPIPSPARREEVRTAVLAASASAPGRLARRAWLTPAVLGAAAAGVVAYVAVPRSSSQPAPAPPMRATVHPHPGARYVATSPSPDEVVQLTDGVVDIDVAPLRPGERFRVIIGDAELEVRGTAFTVTASDQRLQDVAVAHGRVDLRLPSSGPATLGAGQSWHAAPVAAVEPSLPSPPPAPSAPPAIAPEPAIASAPPSPHSAPTTPAARSRPHRAAAVATPHDPQPPVASEPAPAPPPAKPSIQVVRSTEEQSYDQAWDALRANQFGKAATGFARVLVLAPDGPLAEDASFWRAVALARGQRTAEAVAAFRDFLDGYGASPRRGEASAMLGWMLIDARAYDEAARWLSVAVGDASPAVHNSAQAGLDAITRSRR